MKPGIDNDHQVIVDMSNDLWFRGMEVKEKENKREGPGAWKKNVSKKNTPK